MQTTSAINWFWLLNLLHKRFTAADGGENIATDTYLVSIIALAVLVESARWINKEERGNDRSVTLRRFGQNR